MRVNRARLGLVVLALPVVAAFAVDPLMLIVARALLAAPALLVGIGVLAMRPAARTAAAPVPGYEAGQGVGHEAGYEVTPS